MESRVRRRIFIARVWQRRREVGGGIDARCRTTPLVSVSLAFDSRIGRICLTL
jgi:hypothetical protein